MSCIEKLDSHYHDVLETLMIYASKVLYTTLHVSSCIVYKSQPNPLVGDFDPSKTRRRKMRIHYLCITDRSTGIIKTRRNLGLHFRPPIFFFFYFVSVSAAASTTTTRTTLPINRSNLSNASFPAATMHSHTTNTSSPASFAQACRPPPPFA